MIDFKNEIANELLKNDINLSKEELINLIEIPPEKKMGDYSFPCFRLAGILRKNPKLIADELKSAIDSEYFEKIETIGAYINFYVKRSYFSNNVLNEILEKKECYGSNNLGEGKTVVIEYSAPNIAKPFHIGHIRSTVIGDALKKLYQFSGYKTVAINYIGDYGTQFGIMIAAYKLWGDKEKIDKDPINELLSLYVRYNKEAENNPEMMDQARDYFNKLENKDSEAIELWTWFKEISLREFNRVYKLLNIEFDNYNGESYNSKWIPEVLEELKEKNILKPSEGAYIVDFNEEMTPALIIKSNGSSTYITRDIATAINRMKTYNFEENIYVVATQQNLHFKQLKAILKKMGYDFYDKCEHVGFGMVSMKEGTMSTRKGQVIFLESVLNKAIEKTYKIIEKRDIKEDEKKELAKKIGIGAVKFQELYNNRIKDYVFDWDEVLNFDGETGPYVQYTYARINSLIKKSEVDLNNHTSYEELTSDEEFELIKALFDFKETIIKAKEKKEVSMITRKVCEIAKLFNKYYNTTPILVEDMKTREKRVKLAYATSMVIQNALKILGIEVVEEM